eukprot:CFRG7943T1
MSVSRVRDVVGLAGGLGLAIKSLVKTPSSLSSMATAWFAMSEGVVYYDNTASETQSFAQSQPNFYKATHFADDDLFHDGTSSDTDTSSLSSERIRKPHIVVGPRVMETSNTDPLIGDSSKPELSPSSTLGRPLPTTRHEPTIAHKFTEIPAPVCTSTRTQTATSAPTFPSSHSDLSTPLPTSTQPSPTTSPSAAMEDLLAEIGIDNGESQSLSASSQARSVPVSATSRLFHYGGLVAKVGMNILSDRMKESIGMGERQTESGSPKSRVITEKNADALVQTLCRMRGAALKLGQVLSIQDNVMVPEEIQSIFNRVRLSADYMPARQMKNVLQTEFGSEWQNLFSDFDDTPMAAASIGQVHRATTVDGQELAVKIQYPGIANSIDSDMSLLMRVLKMTNALPEGMFLETSIKCSRDELVEECQYLKEAQHMERFRNLLKGEENAFHIPDVFHDLTTNRVLAMERVYGVPLEKAEGFSQDVRNRISYNIMRLCLKELFEWKYMQTDPNWANFLYDQKADRLNLLDFGAAREYESKFIDDYLRVIKAAVDGDKGAIAESSKNLGFLTGFEADVMVDAHCEAVLILGEPFAFKGKFDFESQDVSRRIHKLIPTMLKHRLTPPPQETYSLHRKLSGAFLICARLRANIDVSCLFNEIYNQYEFSTNITDEKKATCSAS